MKIKTKPHIDEATDFYDKEMPKVGFNYTFLAVLLTDFVLEEDEKYQMQGFLKEFSYI